MRADACRAPSRATPPLAGASLALFRRPVFAGDTPNADEIRERSVCRAHELQLRRPRPRRLAEPRLLRLERLNLSPSHQGVALPHELVQDLPLRGFRVRRTPVSTTSAPPATAPSHARASPRSRAAVARTRDEPPPGWRGERADGDGGESVARSDDRQPPPPPRSRRRSSSTPDRGLVRRALAARTRAARVRKRRGRSDSRRLTDVSTSKKKQLRVGRPVPRKNATPTTSALLPPPHRAPRASPPSHTDRRDGRPRRRCRRRADGGERQRVHGRGRGRRRASPNTRQGGRREPVLPRAAPRPARHPPDGSANVRAQLTTLWVLGEARSPAARTPRGRPGARHPGRARATVVFVLSRRDMARATADLARAPSGSFDWADESDTTDAFARRVRCVPTGPRAPSAESTTTMTTATTMTTRRPGERGCRRREPAPRPTSRDVDGCLVGCDASGLVRTFRRDAPPTRRRVASPGATATKIQSPRDVLADVSPPAFDLVDGVKDPKTGERRRVCYARMFGEPNPETGARRGGCLAPIVGCVAADADVDSDSKKDPNRPPRRRLRERRRGGCLGDACVGAEDSETGARRGGCLAPCVGDEDPETGRRRGGCLTARLFGSEDRDGSRRDDGCPRRGRRYPLGRFGSRRENARRRRSRGSRGTETKRMPRGRVSRGVRRVGASARRRTPTATTRRRRRGRGRGRRGTRRRKGKEEKGTRRRPAKKKKNDASSSSEWAETKWRRKPSGYLDVRDAALGARERARSPRTISPNRPRCYPRSSPRFSRRRRGVSSRVSLEPASDPRATRYPRAIRRRRSRVTPPRRRGRARARDAEEALVDFAAAEGRFRFFSIATSRLRRRSARCFSRRPST